MNAKNLDFLAGIVDELGIVKAQIAELKKKENALKQTLIDSKLDVIEGALYRAAISDCAGKEIINWEKIARRFNPSAQMIAGNTSFGEDYFTVRVSAHKA